LFQDNQSRFYGTWELEILGFNLGNPTTHTYWTFYKNKDFKSIELTTFFYDEIPIINFEEDNEKRIINVKNLGQKTEQWGSYNVESGRLFISGVNDTEIPLGIGLDYNFINDNQLTIDFIMFKLNLKKIIESTIKDPAYNLKI